MSSTRRGGCCRCGLCCWDFKSGDPRNRCEHLGDDMKTCLIWDNLEKLRPECFGENFPQIHHVVDLPPECTFWWEDTITGETFLPGVIDREKFARCNELKRFVVDG